MSNIAFAKTGLTLKFDLGGNIENFKSDDHCKLLTNLAYTNPYDNFYKDLDNLFSSFGKIREIMIRYTPNLFAIVEFCEEENAENALKS